MFLYIWLVQRLGFFYIMEKYAITFATISFRKSAFFKVNADKLNKEEWQLYFSVTPGKCVRLGK